MSDTKNMADAKKRVGRPATSNKAARKQVFQENKYFIFHTYNTK